MLREGQEHYNPVAPIWRMHRACRYCRCSPGEYGEEVCVGCGELFEPWHMGQTACSKACRKLAGERKNEENLRRYLEGLGMRYHGPDTRPYVKVWKKCVNIKGRP